MERDGLYEENVFEMVGDNLRISRRDRENLGDSGSNIL
jgi:hypothetical protein